MTEVVLILTTVPDAGVGEHVARVLVDRRLAACVNVLPPMVSIYRWKGDVQRDAECQLVIKTRRSRVPAVRAALREHHPYELPECVVIPVDDGGPEYLAWVEAETAEDGHAP